MCKKTHILTKKCNFEHGFAFIEQTVQKHDAIIIPCFNPFNIELNPICKSQLAELFCGVFKFCTCYSKNLNISRTKRDKFVKHRAFCMEGNRH